MYTDPTNKQNTFCHCPIRRINMPKIIENISGQLLAEARKQIAERGYSATTVRSIASACGIAVGTVYNYFPSKEMLVASFVAEDWSHATDSIKKELSGDVKDTIRAVYDLLSGFCTDHAALFTDPEAIKVFPTFLPERHGQLRDQIAEMLFPVCNERFTAQFIAEALLTWTVAGTPFDELYSVIERLIK